MTHTIILDIPEQTKIKKKHTSNKINDPVRGIQNGSKHANTKKA